MYKGSKDIGNGSGDVEFYLRESKTIIPKVVSVITLSNVSSILSCVRFLVNHIFSSASILFLSHLFFFKYGPVVRYLYDVLVVPPTKEGKTKGYATTKIQTTYYLGSDQYVHE